MRKSLLSILFASLFVHSQAQVTFKMPMTSLNNRQSGSMRTRRIALRRASSVVGNDAALIGE